MINVPSQIRCVSFDIFDTILIRKYIRPIDLFEDLGNRLGDQFNFGNSFAEARVNAEFELRKLDNFSREVSLDKIYSRLQQRLSLDAVSAELIKQAELELERQSIEVIKKVQDHVRTIRQNGYDVIFTSDTYLPEEYVRELLKSHRVLEKHDYLYASSTLTSMKANGELFKYILEHRGLQARELMHIGDNEQSDYKIPISLGISAQLFEESRVIRYEADVSGKLILSKVAGISRSTRLARQYPDVHHQTIWNVSAGVSAPLLFVMVSWCIRSAIDQGLARLYFLSRDGQIMYKIAGNIIEKHYADQLEIRYLHVSRQALLFPSITKLDAEAFSWIMAPTSILTPRIILNRINFTPNEAGAWLKEAGFKNKLDRHLTQIEREAFKAMLAEHEEDILLKAREYRARVAKYLKQEKMLEKGLFGLVDIGWSGSLQRSISKLLELDYQYDSPITGYYFGVKRRQPHKPNDVMYAWFTDCKNPRPLDRDEYIIPMTELFTAADHGGVVRYAETEGRIIPELKSESNKAGIEWGVETQQDAIIKYTENALEIFTRSELDRMDKEEVVAYIERNYRLFFSSPSLFEAEAYGSYPLAEEQNEAYHMPLARPYTILDLLTNKFKPKPHHHNEWGPAAVLLSGKVARMLMQ